MREWYETKIKQFDDLAGKEMMTGNMKLFLHYQREANTYRQMMNQNTKPA